MLTADGHVFEDFNRNGVKGKTVIKVANGSAIILYSGESIQQTVSKYGGNLRNIAWRQF